MDSRINWTDLADFIDPRLERVKGNCAGEDTKDRARAEEEIALTRLDDDVERLAVLADEVNEQLQREQSRKQSAEGRLTSIIRLMSIAVTVVLSGLMALAVGTLRH